MRIGIDARFFGPQETGIGRYVERLLTHLGRIDDQNHYVVFLRAKAWDLWQPPNDRWSKVLADVPWYGIKEQTTLLKIFYQAHLDLLHVPHFNVPLGYRRPFVVTVHDLILHQFPTERATTLEPILFRLKFAAYQRVLHHAVHGAKRVITVSHHSRNDVIKRLSVPSGRVVVTYESVDPLPEPVPYSSLAERGVNQPYILHVGNSYPHKNLERLLAAVGVAVAHGDHFQLVLVGKRDYFSRRVEQEAIRLGLHNVLFFGFANEQELSGLYREAQAYIFPSMSEGFGLPGLEAMQAGVPVFAAHATSMPEIFSDAASYFDPLDTASIANSIHQALHDTLLRQRLVAAGFQRLKDFSWASMAAETLKIYADVLHEHA